MITLKTIPHLAFLLITVSLMLMWVALSLKDPLLRKCEAVRLQLAMVQEEHCNNYQLSECRRMLAEAEADIRRAALCKIKIDHAGEQHWQGKARSVELARLYEENRELRSNADRLLEEVRFLLQMRRERL